LLLREKKRRKANKKMLAVATFLLFLGLAMIGLSLWHMVSEGGQSQTVGRSSKIPTHQGPHHG
jgi:hypothetical protein